MEASQDWLSGTVDFLVPDSLGPDIGTDLLYPVLGLSRSEATSPTLFDCDEEDISPPMASNPSDKTPFVFESEKETDDQRELLVADTASDLSGPDESDKNVTVIQRIAATNVRSPSSSVANLQLSAEPMLVPETMESVDAVIPPSPDVFDHQPTIIPDSPSDERATTDNASQSKAGEESNNHDDDVVSFKPNMSTLRGHDSISHDGTQQSLGLIESQNFVLRLSQSQASAFPDEDKEDGDFGLITAMDSTLREQLPDVEASSSKMKRTAEDAGISSKPFFCLHNPAGLSEEITPGEWSQEGGISVFKRIKSGVASPIKLKRIEDDSEETGSRVRVKKASALVFDSMDSMPQRKEKSINSPATKSSSSPYKALHDTLRTESVKPLQSKPDKSSIESPAKDVVCVEEDTPNVDQDETMSYSFTECYTNVKDAKSVSAEVSPSNLIRLSGSDSDKFMISQKRMALKSGKKTTTEEEDFPGFESPQPTDVAKASLTVTPTSVKNSKDSEAANDPQTKFKKHSNGNVLNPVQEERVSSKSVDDCQQRQATLDNLNKRGITPDDLQPGKVTSKPGVEGSEAHVIADTGDDKVGEGAPEETTNTITKSQVFSEGSTLAQSTSLDPYTFRNSQSQSFTGVPALPLSDKPYISARGKKTANVKFMRKVLKKKPQQKEDSKSSSSDVHCPESDKSRPARRKKVNQQQDITTKVSAGKTTYTEFTALIDTATFSRPSSLPPTRHHTEGSAQHKGDKGSQGAEGDGPKLTKKNATVSFSSDKGQTSGVCDSGEQVLERTTVQRLIGSKITITNMVIKESFNSKGESLGRTQTSEVIQCVEHPPVVTVIEVSEKMITASLPISPSRSASTATSGDLADVSSSLSRTFSSSSKTSLEVLPVSQSLPTPAQREPSITETVSADQLEKTMSATTTKTNPVSAHTGHSKPDSKRSSTSSNTGQDLFSTPNQSIIDPADSQLGKVLCSSSSFTLDQHSGHARTSISPAMAPPSLSSPAPPSSHIPPSGRSIHLLSPNKSSTAAGPLTPSRKGSTGGKDLQQRRSDLIREDVTEGADIQSTGFSIRGLPASTASGDSSKLPSASASPKPSNGASTQVSLQGRIQKEESPPFVLPGYKSEPVIGSAVMGRWKDGFYYPGAIYKIEAGKRVQVQFDDGSQCWCKPHEVILACHLPVGQSVMVLGEGDNDFYLPGMVMAHRRGQEENGGAIVYQVERDDGVTQRCLRASLILSEDQATCLLSDEELRLSSDVHMPSTSKPGEVSLDNLVEGKRQAKSVSSPSVKASVTDSGRKRKIGPVATSTPTHKQPRKGNKGPSTPVKKTGASNLGSVVSSPLQSRRSPRKAKAGLFATPHNPDLFKGIVFMLTHAEKTAQWRQYEKHLLQYSSLDSSAGEENTDLEADVPPFDKEQLRTLIEQCGGRIVDSLDQDLLSGQEQCYLVAAEHQRTVKYMQALAAGVKVISHQWVLMSVQENKLQGLVAYTLPTGISYSKKKLIEGSHRHHRVEGCPQLSTQSIMVVSSNQDFVDAWTSVLQLSQCHLTTKFPARATKTDPGVDVVVSDASCPASVVRRCNQLDVALVSSEWLAQCLINGHLVNTNGHPKYKHDFMEGDAS